MNSDLASWTAHGCCMDAVECITSVVPNTSARDTLQAIVVRGNGFVSKGVNNVVIQGSDGLAGFGSLSDMIVVSDTELTGVVSMNETSLPGLYDIVLFNGEDIKCRGIGKYTITL